MQKYQLFEFGLRLLDSLFVFPQYLSGTLDILDLSPITVTFSLGRMKAGVAWDLSRLSTGP